MKKKNTIQKGKIMEYEESIRLAQENGFIGLNNRGGRIIYLRNGLKWIHNIESLKKALGTENDQVLRDMGYDVDTYYDVITNQRGLLRYA